MGRPWQIFSLAKMLETTASLKGFPVCGVGGIGTWDDCVRYMMAGATRRRPVLARSTAAASASSGKCIDGMSGLHGPQGLQAPPPTSSGKVVDDFGYVRDWPQARTSWPRRRPSCPKFDYGQLHRAAAPAPRSAPTAPSRWRTASRSSTTSAVPGLRLVHGLTARQYKDPGHRHGASRQRHPGCVERPRHASRRGRIDQAERPARRPAAWEAAKPADGPCGAERAFAPSPSPHENERRTGRMHARGYVRPTARWPAAPSTPRVAKSATTTCFRTRRPTSTPSGRCLYTEYMQEHWNEPLYVRAGGALKHVLSNLTPEIWDDELLVGSQSRYFPRHAGLSGVRDVDARGLQAHQARGGGLHRGHPPEEGRRPPGHLPHPSRGQRGDPCASPRSGRARTGAARPRPC